MVDVNKMQCMLLFLACFQVYLAHAIDLAKLISSKYEDEYQRYSELLNHDCFPEPDVCRNASELVTSKGYPCEEHTVQTADGYLLSLQRIPRGKNVATESSSRPVVFLQHGLLSSSADWLDNLVNQSFPYLLADAGFDVWLGNMRGNTYSKRHVKYKPSDREFWAFSWDEMAKYDLPAMVDYALKVSGQAQLYYVGHSQGTLIGFAQFSQDKQLANKVKAFFAFGPVATVGHIVSPLWTLAYFTPEIKDLFDLFGVHEFLPQSPITKILGQTVCVDKWTRLACENIMFLFAGYDYAQINTTRIPVYVAHAPAGTSVQNVVHFAQMIRSGKFQMYDYGGPKENKKHYNQTSPPEYNPNAVKVPVYLISSENDWLADPKDVQFLSDNLPNIILQKEIPQWDHLDFLWGIDSPDVLYHPAIKAMREHERNIGDIK